MQSLQILAIVSLVIVAIIAIVVWTIVFLEYRKILRQRKIDRLLERIRERAEDSGNESEGDQDELAELIEVGHHVPGDANDM
uniref:Protein Vpu n=1 Tax=Human immunodeficiency virus type 1 TaxID=11676 RepID=A8JZ48_HV1|nr:vpu protein [Human immunodeficiency virus 1]